MVTDFDRPEALQIPDVQPIPPGVQRRKLRNAILLAATFTLFSSMQSAGFIVLFLVIPQVVLIPLLLFKTSDNPSERQLYLARLLIWLVAVIMIFLVHSIREEIHRQNANTILARIETYSAEHGHCPASIDDLELSQKKLNDMLGSPAYYGCEQGRQFFSYAASFTVFHSWRYDFIKHRWKEHVSG